jgi:hypothetical protein
MLEEKMVLSDGRYMVTGGHFAVSRYVPPSSYAKMLDAEWIEVKGNC